MILAPKYKLNFSALSDHLCFQYCNRNIIPFSIAPLIVIAIEIVVALNLCA